MFFPDRVTTRSGFVFAWSLDLAGVAGGCWMRRTKQRRSRAVQHFFTEFGKVDGAIDRHRTPQALSGLKTDLD